MRQVKDLKGNLIDLYVLDAYNSLFKYDEVQNAYLFCIKNVYNQNIEDLIEYYETLEDE